MFFRTFPAGMRFFFSRVFPWPFIIVGGVIVFLGLRGLVNATASVDWPTAQGRVVSSSVESRRSSSGTKGGSSTTYHAKVLYDFSIDGATYSGSRVAYGDFGSSDSAHARNIVKRYPKGKQVTVSYMPDNAETCVLEPGMKAQAWFLPGFGLVFLLVGIGMAVLLPKLMAPRVSATEQSAAPESEESERQDVK